MSEMEMFRQPTHQVICLTAQRLQEIVRYGRRNRALFWGKEMLEGLFNPLHLLLLIFIALIIFGIPLLLVFLLARWLDKRLQRRPGVRLSQ